MKNIEFNQVTWYSKLLSAIVLLGGLPILIFFIGMQYQKTVDVYRQVSLVPEVRYVPRLRHSNATSSVEYTSGIKGVVMIGPTCPVVQEGNELECSDKPFATTLKFINQFGSVSVATSSAKGNFSISLPPGTYTINSGISVAMPSLGSVTVIVDESRYSDVTLTFDSGIR